jgi:pimeloyl-ACP methyl ester carboxylesterase
MDPPGEMIDVGGRRLHLLRRGEGAPTVILEAGGGGGSSTQDWPLLHRVAPYAHVLSYDRAGLGWSDPPSSPKTINGIAGDLDALLTSAEESAPYVLVGSSFGGLLTRAFCRRFPEKVAGAVFLDACDEAKYYPTMQRELPFYVAELVREAGKAERGDLLAEAEPAISAALGPDEMTKSGMRHVLTLRSHFEAALDDLETITRAQPDEMACGVPGSLGDRPLIVLSAGKSAARPEWVEGWTEAQERLARLSLRGVHIVARNSGHSIALENPKLVAAAIEAVVRAVRGAPFDVGYVEQLAARTAR